MAEESDSDRTEEATQTRREEFRKQGQVAQTRELASGLMILGILGIVFAFSKFFVREIYEMFQYSFGMNMIQIVRSGELMEAARIASYKLLILVAPILGVSLVIGLLSSIVQVGFLHVEDAISPNPKKIDPLEGFKRIFSMRSAIEGLKSVLKVMLIGGIVGYLIKNEIQSFPDLMHSKVDEILKILGAGVAKVVGAIGVSMLGLAIMDYFFQWWDLEKRMRMTKQELKEEHKQREGDPLIKARIRKIQRETANRRMMDKVPKADVIITNPTHIAIALKYDDTLPAPQLIAKGADLVAEKIKAIAKEHNIPVVENKPLARTIFKTMKIGQVIPRELFVAVAEVLSYVFKLKKRRRS